MMMMMIQGCALVVPCGPWCLTFTPDKLENLSCFFFQRNHMQGTLHFTRSEQWTPLVIIVT